MRIAFLNIYSGLVDRGAETFVHEVAQRLSKNHEVTLFQGGSPRGGEKYKVNLIDAKVDWNWPDKSWIVARRLFVDYKSRKKALFTLRILSALWKEKFDVVVPLNGGWQPALVRLITWIYGGKMVISGQSGMGWDDRNNLWSFPNAFVALSSKAKKWAKGVNHFIRVEYIPNGVDTKKFTPKKNGGLFRTSLKKPIILCVGALIPSKRIDLTIRAVSKIKNASLLVVGKGGLKSELIRLGKKLLGDRFQLTSLPFKKMPGVYRTVDVFTLVSEDYYSFEIVLVEAMATGLPVVANSDPIRREIVGDAGLLVDPTDTKEYIKTLKKVLNTNWGGRPRKQAEKFSWDIIVEQYQKLFYEI